MILSSSAQLRTTPASETCDSLGVIVASRKTEGPSTCLTVLGIEIDTNALELHLPVKKLEQLADLLAQWRGRRSGSRVGLESLAGLLQHACKVVRPGRTFTRRIYNLLAQTHHFQPHFTIRLSAACRADIEWWCTFSAHLERDSYAQTPSAIQPRS